MQTPELNFLEPKLPAPDLTPPPPPPPPRRYLLLGLILLVGAAYGASWIVHSAASKEAGPAERLILQPKKLSLLRVVKNFIFSSPRPLQGAAADRVNILLLGIGGPGHDGPYLSDTNIIVSLKPSTKEVALISVPRDLSVDMGPHGWRRINYANAVGELERPGEGGAYAQEVFAQTFGLPLPYYLRIDFAAFVELVDAVGGVTIEVPRAFTDTQYPGPAHSFRTIAFAAGRQELTGERALEYARSRHGGNGEGSDFARSRRQAQVLQALKEKLFSPSTYLNPLRLKEVANSLTDHIATNLTEAEVLALAELGRGPQTPFQTLVLDTSPGGLLINTTGEQGAFMLAPKDSNFETINRAIANIFAPPAITSAPLVLAPPGAGGAAPIPSQILPKLEIQNGTWRLGLAARWGERLKEAGFPLIRVGNSLQRPIATTTLYLLDAALDPASFRPLTAFFRAPPLTALPPWLEDEYDNPATEENEQGAKYNTAAQVLIILGTDAKE